MPAAPSAQPRRDLSAILFADVHGYAKLMDRNEERTYERVTRSIRLIKSLDRRLRRPGDERRRRRRARALRECAAGAQVRGHDPAGVSQRDGLEPRRRAGGVPDRHQRRRGAGRRGSERAGAQCQRRCAHSGTGAAGRDLRLGGGAARGERYLGCLDALPWTSDPQEHRRADRDLRDRGQRSADPGAGFAPAAAQSVGPEPADRPAASGLGRRVALGQPVRGSTRPTSL